VHGASWIFPIKPPASVWVPSETPHLKELMDAYAAYAAHPEWWNPNVPDANTYQLVAKYVDVYSDDDPVWERIADHPGYQGVSLIYHEIEELRWLLDRELQAYRRNDPFHPDHGGYRGYERLLRESDSAHAVGLIAEHRYLQTLAEYKFTLGELIVWNPIAEDSAVDLQLLRSCMDKRDWDMVRPGELVIDRTRRSTVYAWYRDLGFRGEYRT